MLFGRFLLVCGKHCDKKHPPLRLTPLRSEVFCQPFAGDYEKSSNYTQNPRLRLRTRPKSF